MTGIGPRMTSAMGVTLYRMADGHSHDIVPGLKFPGEVPNRFHRCLRILEDFGMVDRLMGVLSTNAVGYRLNTYGMAFYDRHVLTRNHRAYIRHNQIS